MGPMAPKKDVPRWFSETFFWALVAGPDFPHQAPEIVTLAESIEKTVGIPKASNQFPQTGQKRKSAAMHCCDGSVGPGTAERGDYFCFHRPGGTRGKIVVGGGKVGGGNRPEFCANLQELSSVGPMKIHCANKPLPCFCPFLPTLEVGLALLSKKTSPETSWLPSWGSSPNMPQNQKKCSARGPAQQIASLWFVRKR